LTSSSDSVSVDAARAAGAAPTKPAPVAAPTRGTKSKATATASTTGRPAKGGRAPRAPHAPVCAASAPDNSSQSAKTSAEPATTSRSSGGGSGSGWSRWSHWLWTLGVDLAEHTALARQVHDELVQAWQSPGRHYHSLEHLQSCLGLLQDWGQLEGLSPAEEAILGLALWFHDAVYDPRSKDNEARSAQLARHKLQDLQLDAGVVAQVGALVLATEHMAGGKAQALAVPAMPEHLVALLLDIDLAILGAPAQAFDRYEAQVAQEYAWVPSAQYALGRAQVLRGFLPPAQGGSSSHSSVYRTLTARAQREAQAHLNLSAALLRVSAPKQR